MAKIGPNARKGRFVTAAVVDKNTHVRAEMVSIKDDASGRELPLKGYGSMRGKFVVKPGVDVSKPIAAQVSKGLMTLK